MRHDEPDRLAPFYPRPTYDERSRLWLFGNGTLLRAELAHVDAACSVRDWTHESLRVIDAVAEGLVLGGKTLVCGVHGEGHRRAAVAPLRWGSPRIVVFSGGFLCHLGEGLRDEPFRDARLWRYEWDERTDLAVSLRAPGRAPEFDSVNPTVDQLVRRLAGAGRKSITRTGG